MQDDIVKFIAANRNILNLVIDLIPIPIFIKDLEGKYIDCNVAFQNFLSISREQIIGKTAHDIWRKDEADVFSRQDHELFKTGGIQTYETKVTSANGQHFVVQFHKQVFHAGDGSPQGFLGAIFDITEKKIQIEKLEIALRRVHSLEGLLPICSWCKRMREADAKWVSVEQFVSSRTAISFTHSICPECEKKLLE